MMTDPLSDLLKTVRLTGAAYFDIAASAPWSVASPPREAILPKILPGADHLIAYHVVIAGRCFANAADMEPIALEAGDVVVFTSGQSHVISSSPGLPADPTPTSVVDVAAASHRPFHINCGADGPTSTNLVCGYLACDARPFNPLIENLPPLIKAGRLAQDDSGWLSHFVRFAVAEAAEKRAGSATMLTKVSEVMFVDVLRRYIEALPPQDAGWLAGLRDPSISKALSLLHGEPARDWTLDALARETGQSRSVLAERFMAIVGTPPMHYLARWRMQIAAERLSAGGANLASVASEVGYESEAAFSRAFKKLIGVPPSDWRRGLRPAANTDERSTRIAV